MKNKVKKLREIFKITLIEEKDNTNYPSVQELTFEEVVGMNRKLVEKYNLRNNANQIHSVRDINGLQSCLGGVFYRGSDSYYQHLPIEKMAGLLLFRISQGQYFIDGNKRTSVLSMIIFLYNNCYNINIDDNKIEGLLWGFAAKKFTENDAIQYVEDNIYPKK